MQAHSINSPVETKSCITSPFPFRRRLRRYDESYLSMSPRVVEIADYVSKPGEYSLLLSDLPKHGLQPLGVLLLDPTADRLHIRLRRDFSSVAEDEEEEILRELVSDLELLAREEGGKAVFDRFQNEASLALRVTDREPITVRNFQRTLNELYRSCVPAKVLQFRTHLPRYTLTVAAGQFLTNSEDIRAEDWIEAPEDLLLEENMFVARIQGHSMEPYIPDGALCIFRLNLVGSSDGRLVLVRNSALTDEGHYTVKRFRSEKGSNEEGLVRTHAWLESLNPAYPLWELGSDGAYQIIAEFVRVIE